MHFSRFRRSQRVASGGGTPISLPGGLLTPTISFVEGAASISAALNGSESDGTQLFSGDASFSSGWSAVGSSTSSGFTDPSGGTGAIKLIEDSSGSRHMYYQQKNPVSTSTDYKCSFYIKAGSAGRYLQLLASGASSGNIDLIIDPSSGVITDSGARSAGLTFTSASVEIGANGFYKVTLVFNSSAETSIYFILAMCTHTTYATFAGYSSNNEAYNGDGSSFVYLWRPKLSLYP